MKIVLLTALLTFCVSHTLRADDNDPAYPKRKRMVEKQIRMRGVLDEDVLNAMLKVKRHLFVPEDVRDFAYDDHPLSIGKGQTISQPFIVGYMTDLFDLKKEDRVLEIGTGSGYQAAVLAEIVKEVYTIEIFKELAVSAQKRITDLGYENIHVRQGDGFQGWQEFAPYDAIIVTAAPKDIPQELVSQLKVGGRMIIPVGDFSQELYLITKTEKGINKERKLPVRFVPMIKGKKSLF